MKPEHVVLATANQGKLKEVKAILGEFAVRVSSAGELGVTAQADESGKTYRENALRKARAVSPLAGGLPVLADDSGLEVEALDGRPGVYSARYGEASAGDRGKISALLAELAGVPEAERRAHFRCVAVLLLPGGKELVAEGRVSGVITREPRGKLGFGYDPVFFYPPLGLTFAELSFEEKNRISHRALALRRLMEQVACVLEQARGQG